MHVTLSNSEQIAAGRSLADKIKQRSTLVGLVEPAGMTVGLIGDFPATLDAVSSIGNAVLHGNFGLAGKELTDLVDRATHPEGIGGAIYKSGLGLKAATEGFVGGLEIYQGVKNKDLFLGLMGVADMMSASASASVAVGQPMVGLGLSLAATASKTAMVIARPDQYSRIQKVKTVFDGAGAISSSLLKAGILVGPALAANAVLGPTMMLYMNNEAFRNRADRVIDWLLDKVPGK